MSLITYRKVRKISGAILVLASMLILVACGSTTTVPSKVLQIRLKHSPGGKGTLSWDTTSQTLSVKLRLTGLAPDSVHVVQIDMGTCKNIGNSVYSLQTITANSVGVGTLVTTVPQVSAGIPANAWLIAVHDGNQVSGNDQLAPIACANVTNRSPAGSMKQSVQVTLTALKTVDQNAKGLAKLTLENDQLQVNIQLSGLKPHSIHMAHIHKGSCAAQGGVVYALNPVVADSHGNGSSTTLLKNVSTIPASGWYVNVHEAGTMKDMMTPIGFDPIACGDVVAR